MIMLLFLLLAPAMNPRAAQDGVYQGKQPAEAPRASQGSKNTKARLSHRNHRQTRSNAAWDGHQV